MFLGRVGSWLHQWLAELAAVSVSVWNEDESRSNTSGSNDVNDDTTISHINMDENAEVQAESKEVESVGVRGSVEL